MVGIVPEMSWTHFRSAAKYLKYQRRLSPKTPSDAGEVHTLMSYRYFTGRSVTYGTWSTGSQDQRDSVGRTVGPQ